MLLFIISEDEPPSLKSELPQGTWLFW